MLLLLVVDVHLADLVVDLFHAAPTCVVTIAFLLKQER